MSGPLGKTATTSQLGYIRSLWRKAEYDARVVTAMSRATLAKVGIAASDGAQVDPIFSALTRYKATELIKQLQHETGHFNG